jgi:hypothetical protein
MTRNHLVLLIAVSLVFLIPGCWAGVSSNITANEVEYPVSFSETFHDRSLKVIVQEDYEEVATFSFTFTKWGATTPIRLESSEDISARLNRIVREHDGDAVVNLSIAIQPHALNGVFLVMKVVGYIGMFVGVVELFWGNNPALGAGLTVGFGSIALLMPTAINIKVQGTVVRVAGG